MTSVFVSPHDDDHALFGAFTCLREEPILVVVYDSYVQERRGLQGCSALVRAAETEEAAHLLGCQKVWRLGLRDDDPCVTSVDIGVRLARLPCKMDRIYLPAFENSGHPQHNLVARVQGGPGTQRYATYTSAGKTTDGVEVPVLKGEWICQKLLALSCYKSQMNLDPRMGCWQHFLRSQEEYYL